MEHKISSPKVRRLTSIVSSDKGKSDHNNSPLPAPCEPPRRLFPKRQAGLRAWPLLQLTNILTQTLAILMLSLSLR
jgi:hypothetical protein